MTRTLSLRVVRSLFAGMVVLLAGHSAVNAELNLDEAEVEKKSGDKASDWKNDWVVEEGFALAIDTTGYQYPTAIAFVPNPGSNPKDPLYFVTELRGKVKVVTNDRTVYTFAEGFLETEFDKEPPAKQAEYGLAGICLEPSRGYLFVTFAYQDGNDLRNNIIRFEAKPETFALKPRSQTAFTDVFAPYESGLSHQIGQCQISDDMLYVGVGDGFNEPRSSQRLDTFRGKMLRMTLDGRPAPGNPLYESDAIDRAANYVLAYGLRNPFGLEIVDGRAMVAENGVHSDRFFELDPGRNYLWDGSDMSIAANADYVFLESVGPGQMDYYQRPEPAFPAPLEDQFYVALSSLEIPGIMRIPYSVEQHAMLGVPGYLLRSTEKTNWIAALAFGPDALYFAPLMPLKGRGGAVMKVSFDPQNAHFLTLTDMDAVDASAADGDSVMRLMHRKGCFGCHKLEGVYERGGSKGPMLGDDGMIARIEKQISSPAFLAYLDELDARDEAPYNQYVEARDEVAAASGHERVRIWMKYQIQEPRFDGPSTMPNLDLTEVEAETITRYLVGAADEGFIGKLKKRLFRNPQRTAVVTFSAGVLAGLPLWLLMSWVGRRRSRRSV